MKSCEGSKETERLATSTETTVLADHYLTSGHDDGDFFSRFPERTDLFGLYDAIPDSMLNSTSLCSLSPPHTYGRRGRWTITVTFEADPWEGQRCLFGSEAGIEEWRCWGERGRSVVDGEVANPCPLVGGVCELGSLARRQIHRRTKDVTGSPGLVALGEAVEQSFEPADGVAFEVDVPHESRAPPQAHTNETMEQGFEHDGLGQVVGAERRLQLHAGQGIGKVVEVGAGYDVEAHGVAPCQKGGS